MAEEHANLVAWRKEMEPGTEEPSPRKYSITDNSPPSSKMDVDIDPHATVASVEIFGLQPLLMEADWTDDDVVTICALSVGGSIVIDICTIERLA